MPQPKLKYSRLPAALCGCTIEEGCLLWAIVSRCSPGAPKHCLFSCIRLWGQVRAACTLCYARQQLVRCYVLHVHAVDVA